jgi:hypothetical protein
MGMSSISSQNLSPASDLGPAHKKRAGNILFSICLLVLAIALCWVFRMYAPNWVRAWFGPVPTQGLMDILLLCGAAISAMLAHECGHLMAAKMLGFEVLGGSLGPLQIQTLHGQWKFSWSSGQILGGSVSATPRSLKHWRGAMMLVAAAGPMATLAAGLAMASLEPGSHAAAVYQVAFVQLSVLLFVLGLIPNSRQAPRRNDARFLLDLALGNAGAAEIELIVDLNQRMVCGERPLDYPQAFLARLAAWRGRPEAELAFAQALGRWALDSGLLELAGAWDLRALALAERCGKRQRNAALASSACFDVIYRGDLETALNKFGFVDCGALFPSCFEHRARAARQFAKGRMHRVTPEILFAQYALPPGVPAYDLDRAMLERLHMKVLLGEKYGASRAAAG